MPVPVVLTDVPSLEAGVVLGVVLLLLWTIRKVSSSRLPPGPSDIPFLGLRKLPNDHRTALRQWGDKYGQIMTMRIMGKPFIVVNSKRVAAELLEKRAGATSARPELVMANELVGLKEDPVQTSDPVLHKQYRRLFTTALSPRAVQAYSAMQERETRQLAADILDTPANYVQHLKRAVASISFAVAYGYKLKDHDPMLLKADRGLRIFEKVMKPGAYFLLDLFPSLQYLPSWFPGAGFKRDAAQWKAFFKEIRRLPFEWVKRDLASGRAKPSFVSHLLEEEGEAVGGHKFEEGRIEWTAGVIHGAGSDTSVAAIHTFLAGLVLFPAVQRKAQAELDRVIGKDRLPTIADKDDLPYCNAIVLETLRWMPVATLGLPHVLQNDEEIEGYVLPKGTTVLANIMFMARDEQEYPAADQFRPERFLTQAGDSWKLKKGGHSTFGFGYGRRLCPGMYLAEATVFAAIVSILWSSNITGEQTIQYCKEPGVNRPEYFPITVKERFPGAESMLRGALID